MKCLKFLLLLIAIAIGSALCIVNCAFSQNPLVKMWDAGFGGVKDERLYSLLQTDNGGYILGGWSTSGISGDKSQANWDVSLGTNDYWIVRTDSIGNKIWDKRFGGTSLDFFTDISQTRDGGFIIGGYSGSPISGNKSEPSIGGYDYWIVKITSNGTLQWEKDFAGGAWDQLQSVEQTSDGGYILGGYSESGIGYDKSEACWGLVDYWVIKTDSMGNKEWDRDFGGSFEDHLLQAHQTIDKGFILCGMSYSGISGNKTSASLGGTDFWIVKLDSLGNKVWENAYGGSDRDEILGLVESEDGSILLAGNSWSPVSGNKTQPVWGTNDFWILKIDSLGNVIWDKDLGGIYDDYLTGISRTPEGNYLLSGYSNSPISGDKTENNIGIQTWIIYVDSLANKIWDKTVYTAALGDFSGYGVQATDKSFTIANFTVSGIGGYKSQDNRDPQSTTYFTNDYWMVNFFDSTLFSPAASFSSPSPAICPGICEAFINSSLHATAFQWSFPGASPDTSTLINPVNICYANSGSYDVQLIATNANGSDTLLLTNYITVYPSPSPQSITQSGDTLFAIAGSASYQWYFNGNQINGATNYFYVASASGDYNVVATDENDCEVEAVIFDVVAGLTPALSKIEGVLVYPNPITDKLEIKNLDPNSDIFIKIYNIIGTAVLKTENCKLETCSMDVSGLSQGTYILEISNHNTIFRKRIIKQ